MGSTMANDEQDQLAERVGAAVRARRKSKGYSQEALAAEIGISVITLSNIERGENVPSLGVFLRLVRAVGVDTAELVDARAAARRVNRERLQLEEEARELLRSIELRDLKLLVGMAKAMKGP
jgi:transcriptional regulator with XRE-family HTH domain